MWRALLEIPYGETITYTELAARAGRPGAARAAGAANGRNPIAILIPCHRVVGTGGALTGYAGGVDAKAWLLAHERGDRSPAPSPGSTRPANHSPARAPGRVNAGDADHSTSVAISVPRSHASAHQSRSARRGGRR